jgi:hypothetical protein
MKISANDPEGDSVKFSLLNAPEGASFTDSSNGKATFLWVPPYTGPWSSVNSPFKVTLVALDGNSTSKEDVEINVIDKNLGAKGYAMEIGSNSGFFSDFITVPIKLTNLDSISSINLLLNFDPSALSLLNVSKANTRTYNWEYFQYNQPASGDIRISGLADIPLLPLNPPLPPGEGVIANLNFQIILDPSPLSLSTSLRFKFSDSTDNTLNGALGQNFISQKKITYQDGFIYIQKLDVLLGDINLNTIPYEVGDATLFSNYLTNPVKYAFNKQQERNSDVNEDGICCSLADFIYLLNKILEGPVLEKLLPRTDINQVKLKKSSSNLDLFVDSDIPIGGAFLVIKHPGIDLGTPVLSSEAKEMIYLMRDYSGELRLLIYSSKAGYVEPGQRKLFTIPILRGEGMLELSKAYFSDDIGNLISVKISLEEYNEIPERFTLFQNYPNPFNPETNITFSLPEERVVNLKIYNLKGQLVKMLINQKLSPGYHTFTWDGKDESGKDVSSGIYFNRLSAGDYSETKKMIKVK